MRRQACYGVALGLSFLLPIAASAEVRCDIGVKFRPLEVKPITLHFRDVPLSFVFGTIGTLTGTPFRVPPDLNYRVAFDIRHVAACHVLEIIGESQSLTYLQDGDTIVVVPPEPLPPAPIRAGTPKDH
jgi:hypothetical protein